ncbi:Xaa-Pro aminopeptidase [Peptostreptococcaceae bacterium pGA-8]|nr:Xaa-Pro aminopeptidase [Peptostreptococcaceae bacterium pGA-8]
MRKELVNIRKEMEAAGVDVYYIPMSDFHGSEYIADHFKAIRYISGFTGSAGELLIFHEDAYLWTDGRYHIQAENELEGSGISLMKMGNDHVPSLEKFLSERLKHGEIVGFDSRVVSGSKFDSFADVLGDKGIFVNYNLDLVDIIWNERPGIPMKEIKQIGLGKSGQNYKNKIKALKDEMKAADIDCLLLTKPDDIAWLFNLRGSDIDYNPVFYSYALIKDDETAPYSVRLYIQDPDSALYLVDSNVGLSDYSNIHKDLEELPEGSQIGLDFDYTSVKLIKSIPGACKIIPMPSPATKLKAIKNPIEISATKKIHIDDGRAMVRFICWLKSQFGGTELSDAEKLAEFRAEGDSSVTELSAAEKLAQFRAESSAYIGASFSTISAYGPSGAVVHYAAGTGDDADCCDGDVDVFAVGEHNRRLRSQGFYLVDSGGQYDGGTTDITRTVALGPLTDEMKRHYTAVLKGHIALATAEFSPDTTGAELDAVARAHVNAVGENYNHGTGHGVGHMLCVHEGPVSISPREKTGTFKPGMITSNEPGIYIPGKYGIRIEDEMLCIPRGESNLAFTSITCCPFERDAIDISMLSEKEVNYINEYHSNVYEKLAPLLSEEERQWLEKACKPVK